MVKNRITNKERHNYSSLLFSTVYVAEKCTRIWQILYIYIFFAVFAITRHNAWGHDWIRKALLLVMVVSSFPRIHNRWFMRITNLGLKFTSKFLSQRAFPSSWARFFNLLDHFFHRGTLAFQLMHPRPHAIHVEAQHLILPHRTSPRAALLRRRRRRHHNPRVALLAFLLHFRPLLLFSQLQQR